LTDQLIKWCVFAPPLQEILGPVGHLRNPLLRERHWQAIANLLGQNIQHSDNEPASIQQLLNLQVRAKVAGLHWRGRSRLRG
jgi:hypothetical protein